MGGVVMKRWQRLVKRIRERAEADGGFTMLEVVMTMTIMAIVLVMFTAGISQAFTAEERVDAGANSESQITIAFQRLDREVRYAAGISTPGTVGANTFVEFLTTFTGTNVCTELRLNSTTQQLSQRTWTQGQSPLVPTSWSQLATGVTSATPFTVYQSGAVYNFQRMEVQLAVTTGTNKSATTKQSDITFTALNTTLSTSSGTTCTEGRSVP